MVDTYQSPAINQPDELSSCHVKKKAFRGQPSREVIPVSDLPGPPGGVDPLASFFDPLLLASGPPPAGAALPPPLASFLAPLLLASGRPPGGRLDPLKFITCNPLHFKRLNHNLDIGLYCLRVNNLYLPDYISTHVFLRNSVILSYYKRNLALLGYRTFATSSL